MKAKNVSIMKRALVVSVSFLTIVKKKKGRKVFFLVVVAVFYKLNL